MSKKVIYVVCPARKQPIGGVKQLYRLVDTLVSAGHEAYIIHGQKNFRVTWFKNQTPIKYFPDFFALLSIKIKKKKKLIIPFFLKQLFRKKIMPELDSIIVFPEIYGPFVNSLVPNNEVVIFNQNCYYSFNNFAFLQKQFSIYQHSNTLGCIVVSKDSLNYMQYAFPSLKVCRIRLGINSHFEYSSVKKKQIAFMPRKLSEDSNQLFHIISNRIDLKDWKFVSIDKMNEIEVANILKESIMFLSFNHQEGFGLPPAEAMACGCYVIGYTGNGGKEYFNEEFSSPIENRNIVAFAKEVEKVINEYEIDPTKILNRGLLASRYILDNYNIANETEDILKAWEQITTFN